MRTYREFERAEERLIDALRDLADMLEQQGEANPFDAPTKAARKEQIKRVSSALTNYVHA